MRGNGPVLPVIPKMCIIERTIGKQTGEVEFLGKERMLVTGGHALEGQVRVSGGKNTAVAVIPATLLCDEP